MQCYIITIIITISSISILNSLRPGMMIPVQDFALLLLVEPGTKGGSSWDVARSPRVFWGYQITGTRNDFFAHHPTIVTIDIGDRSHLNWRSHIFQRGRFKPPTSDCFGFL